MHIVHIASELAPIAKAGGLGDVVHGLSREQVRAGMRVEVIIPRYDVINYSKVQNLTLSCGDLWSQEDSFEYHNAVYSALVDNIETFLIEPHHNQYYFNRKTIYGTLNDIERFVYFSRTALEFLLQRESPPDIIHIHDWPTALVAPMIKTIFADTPLAKSSVVFTIHNIEHQGKCHPRAITRVGLRGLDFRTEDSMQDSQNPALLNLLKGGIVYADQITTVSPSYAKEIKTKEMSFGLHETVIKYSHKISGILNGIELESWNPASDTSLFDNYPANPSYLDTVLENKLLNKQVVLKNLGLAPNQKPLVVCVSRIARQKGPHLIQAALHHTLEKGATFILLGSTSDPELEKEFLHIKAHYKDHPNLYIGLTFNETLARQLYAAADAIVIPSLYEPCGLTQMISMHYGTIPIARSTGGLADTIYDFGDESKEKTKRTGFLFQSATEKELIEAIDRAFTCYLETPHEWKSLVRSGLNQDLGWKSSSDHYQKLYKRAKEKTG